MNISQHRVIYSPAFRDEVTGQPFFTDGAGHWPTIHEALKDLKQLQPLEGAKLFVAEVTIREAVLPLEEVS